MIWKNRDELILFFIIVLGKIAWSARLWINYSPQQKRRPLAFPMSSSFFCGIEFIRIRQKRRQRQKLLIGGWNWMPHKSFSPQDEMKDEKNKKYLTKWMNIRFTYHKTIFPIIHAAKNFKLFFLSHDNVYVFIMFICQTLTMFQLHNALWVIMTMMIFWNVYHS